MGLIFGLVVSLVAAAGVGVYFAVARDSDTAVAKMRIDQGGGFDDLLRLDPCSFVEPKMFAAFANNPLGDNPEIRIEPINFATCNIQLASTDIRLESRLADAGELSGKSTTTQRGSVRIADLADTENPCQQLVFRPDGVGVRVWDTTTVVNKWFPDSREQCRISDIATEAAVAALSGNTADRIEYPVSSLGGTDPCSLISAADLNTVSATSIGKQAATTLAHSCTWNMAGVTVHLMSELRAESKSASAAESTPMSHQWEESIAGRRTRVSEVYTFGCVLHVEGLTWKPWQGSHFNYREKFNDEVSNFVERAVLMVTYPANSTAACDKGKALAAAVWPKLPKG